MQLEQLEARSKSASSRSNRLPLSMPSIDSTLTPSRTGAPTHHSFLHSPHFENAHALTSIHSCLILLPLPPETKSQQKRDTHIHTLTATAHVLCESLHSSYQHIICSLLTTPRSYAKQHSDSRQFFSLSSSSFARPIWWGRAGITHVLLPSYLPFPW